MRFLSIVIAALLINLSCALPVSAKILAEVVNITVGILALLTFLGTRIAE